MSDAASGNAAVSARTLDAVVRDCWQKLGIPLALLAERNLPVFEQAESLVLAETGTDGRLHHLAAEAAVAWKEMKSAAHSDSVQLHIVSAFRSVERQAEIVARKLQAGQSLVQILSVSAPPGCSEHHTGRAIDVGTPDSPPLELEFEQTQAFSWLLDNGESFGFRLSYPPQNDYGFEYEPWHWCFLHS
jgi:D-alanyl-D-alanine carboxypeptidase